MNATTNGRWIRKGNRIVLLPSRGEGMQGEAAGPLSPHAAIHPNIDVHAQYALVRMSKADPAARAAAAGMLNAVKAGRLGIYKVDQQVPALRAKKLGGWWNVIPRGQDAVVFLDPAQPGAQMPLIVFRDAVKNAPAQLDPALQAAWDTYQALGSCQVPGGGTLQAELTPGIVPANLVPGLLCQITPTGGNPGTTPGAAKTFIIECTHFEVRSATQWVATTVADALDDNLDRPIPAPVRKWLEKLLGPAAGGLRDWILLQLERLKFGKHRLLQFFSKGVRALPLEMIMESGTFKITPVGGGAPITLCYRGCGFRVAIPGGNVLGSILNKAGLKLSEKEMARLGRLLPPAIRQLFKPLQSIKKPGSHTFSTTRPIRATDFSGDAAVGRSYSKPATLQLAFHSPAFDANAGGTKLACAGCEDRVVPIWLDSGTRDILALTWGSLTVENCQAPPTSPGDCIPAQAQALSRGRGRGRA